MERQWRGTGSEFGLRWGGRDWTLKVDGDRPGVRSESDGIGPFLSLHGLAASARDGAGALDGAALVGCERRHGRVEATYAPTGWGDLTVRAAWSPAGEHGLDLEITASARSVGELRALEVIVADTWPAAGTAEPADVRVEARDARSAGLSYDGREPDLAHLITLPPGDPNHDPTGPIVLRPAPADDGCWLLIQPGDVSRRIVVGRPAWSVRHALFGHDLERGVVLRARLRALWLPGTTTAEQVEPLRREFLGEPLPLST